MRSADSPSSSMSLVNWVYKRRGGVKFLVFKEILNTIAVSRPQSNDRESPISQESEVSQTRQETDSSQVKTEHLDPWSRIQGKALKRHKGKLNALISEYEGNRDSDNVVCVKAENALLPVYRKYLRKVLLEYLQWVRAMKKRFHLP